MEKSGAAKIERFAFDFHTIYQRHLINNYIDELSLTIKEIQSDSKDKPGKIE
jgi:hypothetical protein